MFPEKCVCVYNMGHINLIVYVEIIVQKVLTNSYKMRISYFNLKFGGDVV